MLRAVLRGRRTCMGGPAGAFGRMALLVYLRDPDGHKPVGVARPASSVLSITLMRIAWRETPVGMVGSTRRQDDRVPVRVADFILPDIPPEAGADRFQRVVNAPRQPRPGWPGQARP